MRITRSELLREMVEEYSIINDNSDEDASGRSEWREEKKKRLLKSLRENKSPKGKDKRRSWNIQRAIRRGEYNFSGTTDKQKNNNEDINDDDD